MRVSWILAFCTLLAAPAVADDLPVYFHIESQGKEWNFAREPWEKAVRNSGGPDMVGYLHKGGVEAFREAQSEAASFGWEQPVVSMTTANLPVANSREFRDRTRSMDEGIAAQTEKLKDTRLLFSMPMCRLYELPSNGPGPENLHFLAAIDRADAQVICYQATMGYFMTPPGEDGTRPAPVFVDPMAMILQEQLPDLKLHSAYLADKTRKDDRGRFLQRETNVFAPNEEIFLKAYFENVRRDQIGSPLQSYKIQLDLEIRDASGGVLSRRDSHYVYEGNSLQHYPVDKTQFYNNITAGIGLDVPGDYQVAFIFTDLNAVDPQPVEAAFDVTIQ